MSHSLNRHEIIGNLGADPELRYTGSGIPVCSFSIATNETAMVDGEKKQYTEWHRVTAWRKAAEILSQYLRKGSRVYIAGPVRHSSWEDPEGGKHSSSEIIVEDWVFLDGKQQESGS